MNRTVPKETVRRLAALCAAGVAAGILAHGVRGAFRGTWRIERPSPAARRAEALGIEILRWQEASGARAAGAVVLDARPARAHRRGRIPGALSFPAEAGFESLLAHAERLFAAPWILVYCESAFCDEGVRTARFLRESGLERVALYADGLEDWLRRGGRLERGDP